jgi:hypothetical protein
MAMKQTIQTSPVIMLMISWDSVLSIICAPEALRDDHLDQLVMTFDCRASPTGSAWPEVDWPAVQRSPGREGPPSCVADGPALRIGEVGDMTAR